MKRNLPNIFHSSAAILLLGFLLLFIRAWPRLIYPEVWIEDGTFNLLGFINHGWLSIFSTVGGYLVLVPKLISFTAFSISFIAYPLISTILAWIFILFVFFVIARAPTYLKGQLLLASSCFLIPSDPECFGLPMYTYWWSSLLLFLLVFWKENQANSFRVFLLFIATLSSPVCLVTLPLFWFRSWKFRAYRSEKFLAILATSQCLIQLGVMVTNSNPGQLSLSSAPLFIPVFLGSFLVGNLNPSLNWIFGLGLLLLLYFAISKDKSWTIALLLYLFVASILMSMYRVDIKILNPVDAGPRYFFFPYILLGWLLIELLFTNGLLIKISAGFFLILSFANAIPHLDRNHDRLFWAEHVYRCAKSSTYTFPIHFAGSKENTWSLTLTGEQCAKLIARDPFH